MRLRFTVVSIQRNAYIRHADQGAVREERVTVVLEPVHAGGDPTHPNFTVWGARLSLGELRLAELPDERAAPFRLHGTYTVTIEEATK